MLDTKYVYCVAQKAIIRINDTYLVLKRSKDAKVYPSYWDFAGGKIEHGENHKDALAREVKEETGIEILVEDSEFIYIEEDVGHAYCVLFGCEKSKGEVKLSSEHTEFKWVTKEQALKLKLEPYLKEFFESID